MYTFFFFNYTATTEIYTYGHTLSLHDALPISKGLRERKGKDAEMDFDLTDRQVYWRDRVRDFIERKVRPAVPTYQEQDKPGDRWKVIHSVEDMKAEAKEDGIWNLFVQPKTAAPTTVENRFKFK